MSLSNYAEALFLNCMRGGGAGVSITAPAAMYVQIHTGEPGEDGTANNPGEARQAVTFGPAAEVGGVMTILLTNTPSWSPLAVGGVFTHATFWDSLAGGNCWGSGQMTVAASKAVGESFSLTQIAITAE